MTNKKGVAIYATCFCANAHTFGCFLDDGRFVWIAWMALLLIPFCYVAFRHYLEEYLKEERGK